MCIPLLFNTEYSHEKAHLGKTHTHTHTHYENNYYSQSVRINRVKLLDLASPTYSSLHIVGRYIQHLIFQSMT